MCQQREFNTSEDLCLLIGQGLVRVRIGYFVQCGKRKMMMLADVRAYKLAINDESEGVIFLPQHIVPHPLEQSEITLSCSPSGV